MSHHCAPPLLTAPLSGFFAPLPGRRVGDDCGCDGVAASEIGALGGGGGIVQSKSADFDSVFLVVTRRPMMAAEIETETGVHAEVVAEVLRIFALTGSVARRGDRHTPRHTDALEMEHRSLVR
jgi:hypothetical protein